MNELLIALVQLGILDAETARRIARNLDPVQAQAWAESVMFRSVASGLNNQQARMINLLAATNGAPTSRQLSLFWENEDEALFNAIEPALNEIAQERAIVSVIGGGNLSMWEGVNEAVIDWVNDYYTSFDLLDVGAVPNLNTTSRTEFARSFLDWQRGELETAGFADGLPQLIRAIEPTFGTERARRIAATETTRILYETTYQAAGANEFIVALRWYSAADERVCPVCGPNHGVTVPKTSRIWPNGATIPAHPNCRCRAIEETSATLQTPLGPAEYYEWNEDTWQAYQDRTRIEQRQSSAVNRLISGMTP